MRNVRRIPATDSAADASLYELRTQLTVAIDRANRGLSTVVTRHGKPVAIMLPVEALTLLQEPVLHVE